MKFKLTATTRILRLFYQPSVIAITACLRIILAHKIEAAVKFKLRKSANKNQITRKFTDA